MATQPLGTPKFRAFDSNGDPLSGGKLYSYEAGTTTPLATYTTRAGDVANANPVILDANGEANVWMTPGVLYKFVLHSSADVQQFSIDNYPSPSDPDTTYDVATDPGGRLTLTTAVPVTTSDVTGATTVYYTPHKHNRIPIYNGSEWVLETFAELSQTTTDATKSPAAVANSSNYDLFVWNDSGTIRLSRGPAWSSATSRGSGAGTTEITRLNGRYVNAVSITNGPAANRGTYVGTVRSDGSAQINDSKAKRHTWNAYHRVQRQLYLVSGNSSWNYTTATWRQAEGLTTNQLDFVTGLDEDAVSASVCVSVGNSGGAVVVSVAIGLDSTTAPAQRYGPALSGTGSTSTASVIVSSTYEGHPGIGSHALVWLEWSTASGTTKWWRANSDIVGGLSGIVFA